MNAVKKVLIVGGGIGGLCAAIALRRKDIEVDLVELKTQWTVYGVGIIQQSNVVREMAKLGVLDGYLDAAYTFEDVTSIPPPENNWREYPVSAWRVPSIQPTSASRAWPCIKSSAKPLLPLASRSVWA